MIKPIVAYRFVTPLAKTTARLISWETCRPILRIRTILTKAVIPIMVLSAVRSVM